MARAQASLVAAVVAIIAAATVLGTASGASYTVGEPGGSWDLQTNLTAWSSTIDFHPGDQLVFKYDASAHDVVEVTQAGYGSCSAASPVAGGTHQTGSDAVKLNYVGRRYFICSKPGHCDAGMKLEVRVTPMCTNDRGFNTCYTMPLGAAPGYSSGSLGSLLVTIVSLLLALTLTIA
jgi:uncharacterized cupredoxin-like copper-binding protein